MKTLSELPDFMTAEEVAEYLRIPIGSVYIKIKAGKIPTLGEIRPHRVPKQFFIESGGRVD